jgi:sulfite exporter TauE/SafE
MHIILAAAIAGMLATPHCAAMCGGFATACARPRSGLAAWHAGRVTTYVLLGAAAGTIGGTIPGPRWIPAALAAVLLVWFSAALAGITHPPTVRVPGLTRVAGTLARRNGIGARSLFGSLTGLLPCGMVYAALSMAVAAGGALTGAGAMLAFGAATVPGLTVLSIGLQRVALRSLWTRRAVALVILMLGLWSVSTRVATPADGGHIDHSRFEVGTALTAGSGRVAL